MYETITVTTEGHVAWLTLNRPKVLNAINKPMLDELTHAFDELDANEDVRVVVIRGEGRAFCAGADLAWSEENSGKERVENNRMGQRVFARMQTMSKPIFAAVHGYTLGGGLELALAADFIVCSDDTRFAFPEITLSADPPYRPKITEEGDPDQPEFGGIVPGWGGVKRLPERVGKAAAMEMLCSGARINAERAARMGLTNDVYPAEGFGEQVAELARRIGAMNRYNLRLMKELVVNGFDMLEMHP